MHPHDWSFINLQNHANEPCSVTFKQLPLDTATYNYFRGDVPFMFSRSLGIVVMPTSPYGTQGPIYQIEFPYIDPPIWYPHGIYFLINTGGTHGASVEKLHDNNIGHIRCSFSDGRHHDLQLQIGHNVRDWSSRSQIYGLITSCRSLDSSPVYVDPDTNGTGVLDCLYIHFGDKFRNVYLTGITITHEARTIREAEAIRINLYAITVKSHQPTTRIISPWYRSGRGI